jgi:asparagine synthase (glutamine-hydrolysing)
MCALNGILAYHSAANAPKHAELVATRDHMAARGPDGSGEWWSEDRRIGLGHRRLAIVDLNAAAGQPMTSGDERFVVVFNGEIYNHSELRASLERKGAVFRTRSDTEVLLHLFAHEGEAMLSQLRGMFAFAIWDTAAKRLFLARDPYGIKPLYFANDGWTFRFASQVKALVAGGAVSREIEPAGAVGFALLGSVPDPFTLYRGIEALPAGCSLVVDELGPRAPQRFVSVSGIIGQGPTQALGDRALAAHTRSIVSESVRAHLMGDVEAGVFLSSGIDSGVILGCASEARSHLSAVTIAFDSHAGGERDESLGAAAIARAYGARHTVRRVSEEEFEHVLPKVFDAMDQPSVDGVNTWFAAMAAKEQGLKVALSGIGGDELFGGYPGFRQIPQCVRWLGIPAGIPGLGRGLRALVMASGLARAQPKWAGLLEYGGSYGRAYLLRRSVYLPFELERLFDRDFVRDGLRRLRMDGILRDAALDGRRAPARRVASLEASLYLRNQLLRDADWAGMAHGVEIRTPLADIQLLNMLAPHLDEIHAHGGKRLLAAAPTTPLPVAVQNRPKTGFATPIERATGAGAGHAARAWSRIVAQQVVPETWAQAS